MRTLQLLPHLTDEQLKAKLLVSKGTKAFDKWQIFYLIQIGRQNACDIIAPLVGLSTHSVYKIVEAYNKSGEASISLKKRGGRRNALLSIEAEKNLFLQLQDQASKGLIKSANDIRHMVEQKVGKAVSDDYLWDLLKRNGWKKKVPRPHHPKRKLEDQADFKKNSRQTWSP